MHRDHPALGAPDCVGADPGNGAHPGEVLLRVGGTSPAMSDPLRRVVPRMAPHRVAALGPSVARKQAYSPTECLNPRMAFSADRAAMMAGLDTIST
jgi:hypothetical protein